MVSEKEIEAARAVLERRIYDEGGCEAEQVPAMVREMLEAAARVRAEAAEGGEVVASIPLGKGNVIDGGGANISQPLHNKYITIRDCEVHPAPQPSGAPISLADAEKAFLDRVWPKLQNGCYRAYNLIPIEIQRLDLKEFVRDGLCAVLEAVASVRAENDAFRDAVVTGLGAVKINADGTTERVDLRAEADVEGGVKPLDEDDYEEIISAAANNMRKAASGIRGQMVTVQDSLEWWVMKETERRILSALTAGKPHPDDEAVDRFAAAMKAKLKWEREERGRYGWNDPEVCSEEYLAQLLIEHLAKGNDGNFEDVANLCMMLHQRGAHPRVLADALTSWRKDREQETD